VPRFAAIARLLPVFLAAMFFCPAAHATNVALTSDAHVSMTRSTTNFGTLSNLYVGNGNTALLQFDLSTLPTGLTSTQISHATLTVFVNRVNTGGTVNLSPVTSAWSESAVTYATIPAIGAPVNGFPAAIAGQYVTLDVTTLVQGWVTTPATNFGFALTSTAANVLLDSKENDETGHAASLDITITSMGATGAQGTQGEQGTAGTPGMPGATGAAGAQGIQGSAGPTGATGAAGTIGAVTNWSSSVTYQAGQVVFCAACSTSGSSYVALATNTNQDPPTQTGVWQLIASAGATGPQGIQGVQGNPGIQGPMGNTGAAGPAGSAGAQGATGTLSAVTNWSSATPYTVGQVVFCTTCSTNGSSFIALSSNTAMDPSTHPIIWQLIAQAGATGSTGPMGTNGAPGATGSTGPTGSMGPIGATGSITNGFVWSSLVPNEGAPGPFFVAPLANTNGQAQVNSQLAFLPAPAACTVRSLTINALATNLANPIEADTMAFTVVMNDVPTSMTCQIATMITTPNNATLSCSDSTHTFTVAQGDRISLEFTESTSLGNSQSINAGTTLVCN
jgi:hypothetical protein